MAPKSKLHRWYWLTACALGLAAGLGLLVFMGLWAEKPEPPPETERDELPFLNTVSDPSPPAVTPEQDEPQQLPTEIFESTVAYRYADALRNNRVDEVIGMTWWMQERLQMVQRETGDAEAVELARTKLRNALRERRLDGAYMRAEGIEDQYVFAPGVELAFVEMDDGEQTLAKPIRQRIWMRVTFPEYSAGVRDESGRRAPSLEVGVNISEDGYVLKANVVGNLEFR